MRLIIPPRHCGHDDPETRVRVSHARNVPLRERLRCVLPYAGDLERHLAVKQLLSYGGCPQRPSQPTAGREPFSDVEQSKG